QNWPNGRWQLHTVDLDAVLLRIQIDAHDLVACQEIFKFSTDAFTLWFLALIGFDAVTIRDDVAIGSHSELTKASTSSRLSEDFVTLLPRCWCCSTRFIDPDR